jgi:hypothetical protein
MKLLTCEGVFVNIVTNSSSIEQWRKNRRSITVYESLYIDFSRISLGYQIIIYPQISTPEKNKCP